MLLLIKYWKWIVICLLSFLCIAEFKYYNNKVDSLSNNFTEQSQNSHLEYENKLNDLISQKSEIEKELNDEINLINVKAGEDLQKLAENHNQAIEQLDNEHNNALEKLKVEKVKNIKKRIEIHYNDPNKIVEETAQRFGFKVIKND